VGADSIGLAGCLPPPPHGLCVCVCVQYDRGCTGVGWLGVPHEIFVGHSGLLRVTRGRTSLLVCDCLGEVKMLCLALGSDDTGTE